MDKRSRLPQGILFKILGYTDRCFLKRISNECINLKEIVGLFFEYIIKSDDCISVKRMMDKDDMCNEYVEICIRYGSTKVLEHIDGLLCLEWSSDSRMMELAAESANLSSLKFLESKNAKYSYRVTENLVNRDAINILKYMLRRGYLFSRKGEENYIYDLAKEKSSRKCLEFFKSSEFNFLEKNLEIVSHVDVNTFKHLYPKSTIWDIAIYKEAVRFGRLDIVDYMHNIKCFLDESVIYQAAYYSQWSCLEYLCKIFPNVGPNTVLVIANNFSRNKLIKILDGGAMWSEKLVNHAAQVGDLLLLKSLLARDKTHLKWMAAINICTKLGHFDCFCYLFDNNCPRDKTTVTLALKYDRFSIISYLDFFGYTFSEIHMNIAASHGSIGCVDYLHNINCPWSYKTNIYAAKFGQLEILKYLHENHCPRTFTALATAAKYNHLNCLIYLHNNGCPSTKIALDNALSNNNIECAKFICCTSIN